MNAPRAEATATFLDSLRDLVWDAADPEKSADTRLRAIETAEQRLRFVARELEISKADLEHIKAKEAA